MGNRKTLQELTFKDNFMFAAVMMDADNCKDVLECALGFPIERVEVSTEKSLIYHPEYKGVRLDVYAKDSAKRHFNVEMQVAEAPEYPYEDGIHTILLNTKGRNKDEVPEQLVKFLKFVGAGPAESTGDYEDELVERLQNAVVKVKASREMENRYMLLEEMMKDEYSAGITEGERRSIRMLISRWGGN